MVEQTNDQMRRVSESAQALKALLAGLRTTAGPGDAGRTDNGSGSADRGSGSRGEAKVVKIDTTADRTPREPIANSAWNEF
jgi:hypothetical protein